MLNEQNNQIQMQSTRKDNEIKELESQLDELQLKLDSQPFEIEF